MVNKVILVGNVGKDPDIRYFDNGRAVAKFSLATNESYKNKEGQKIDHTEWHNISMWTPLAEIAEKYIQKGAKLYIEGRIRTRKYETKEGQEKYSTDIEAREMKMLGGKSEAYDDNASARTHEPKESTETVEDSKPEDVDDLPF